jgi:hypothetical protein
LLGYMIEGWMAGSSPATYNNGRICIRPCCAFDLIRLT